jgi:hypothetical protein
MHATVGGQLRPSFYLLQVRSALRVHQIDVDQLVVSFVQAFDVALLPTRCAEKRRLLEKQTKCETRSHINKVTMKKELTH